MGGDSGKERLLGCWWPFTAVPVCRSSVDTVAQVRRVHQSVATEGPSR